MRNASISRKEKRKKIIPTEYYFANILLTFYFLGLGPSNIDFPPQSTSEIDMVSFFQFPVPPWEKYPGRIPLGNGAVTPVGGRPVRIDSSANQK